MVLLNNNIVAEKNLVNTTICPGNNWNNATSNGNWKTISRNEYGSSPLNAPITGDSYWFVGWVVKHNDTFLSQFAININNQEDYFVRVMRNGSWYAWSRVKDIPQFDSYTAGSPVFTIKHFGATINNNIASFQGLIAVSSEHTSLNQNILHLPYNYRPYGAYQPGGYYVEERTLKLSGAIYSNSNVTIPLFIEYMPIIGIPPVSIRFGELTEQTSDIYISGSYMIEH